VVAGRQAIALIQQLRGTPHVSQVLRSQEDVHLLRSALGATAAVTAKTVTFVLDKSGSMAGARMTAVKRAMQGIIRDVMYEEDGFSLVTFNNHVETEVPWTQVSAAAKTTMLEAVDRIRPSHQTALYEAVVMAAEQPRSQAAELHRQFLVVLSDGADNSRTSNVAVAEAAVARGTAPVIAIGVGLGERETEVMQRLSRAKEGGAYIASTTDSDSILEAFGHAMEVIQTAMQSEEY